MRVTMLWYGGTSYAAPSNEHAESFPSLRAAVRACRGREDNRDGRAFVHLFARDGSGIGGKLLYSGPLSSLVNASHIVPVQ